jgi:hypothetical protein
VELAPNDIAEIVGLDRAALSFVPRKSPKGRWLAEAATEAFAQQTGADRKQAELAAWLRFSRSDIRVGRDGPTPEALGLPLISRAVWYPAFSRKQAMKLSFRRSSIKAAGKQLNGCAGFLLVTSTDRSMSSLLDAGSLYQRALLRAIDLRVAHHAMSYALEENPWRQEIDSAMQSERPIQFMVRVGQARRLARPSIRRSMATLLENGMPLAPGRCGCSLSRRDGPSALVAASPGRWLAKKLSLFPTTRAAPTRSSPSPVHRRAAIPTAIGPKARSVRVTAQPGAPPQRPVLRLRGVEIASLKRRNP